MTNIKLGLLLAAIVLILSCTGLVSAGAITVTNSTLWTGNASINGTITYAENSMVCPLAMPVMPAMPTMPVMPAMPTMPSMIGWKPIMPSIGEISGISTGTVDFEAIDVAPQELSGGTYNYRNYTVKNSTVRYNGTVTILTTGDVLIDNGTVNTTNSDIMIISGGNIIIKNGGAIYTADSPIGTSGNITLEAADSVDLQAGFVYSGEGNTSGGVLIKAFGSNTITLLNTLIWTGNAEIASGDLELWSNGSIDANQSYIWSGDSDNSTSGHVALYALGSDTITLLGTSIWTGDAEIASGDLELWSGGSINANQSSVIYSGSSNNGTSGHVALYALDENTTILSDAYIYTGEAEIASGDLELLSGGSIDANQSHIWSGNSDNGTSGHVILYAQGGDTITLLNTPIWTGDAEGASGDLELLSDGSIDANQSYIYSGNSDNSTSGHVTLYAQGGDTITLLGTSVWTGEADEIASGDLELWSGGSIDANQSSVIYSGSSNNGTSGHVTLYAQGENTITLHHAYIYTGEAEIASGDLELWSGGSIDANQTSIWSGSGTNGTSGHVTLYAQGGNTITLLGTSIWTGEAEGASGDPELWSGGSIDANQSYIWSGSGTNGTSGHITAYALDGDLNCSSCTLWTGTAAGDSGYLEILAAGPVTYESSTLYTGTSRSRDSGDLSSTSGNAHTTIDDTQIWTGIANSGNSGSILIQDFAPRPEGGVITVDQLTSWTGNADVRSGDITFLTGFNPCEAVEVPVLTPLGALALISLLSAIAAVAIVRKRR